MRKTLRATLTVVGVGVAVAGASAYLSVFLPWQHRWGATDDEVGRPLPGDELVPHPDLRWTRAITIQAPDAVLWSWLVQIGSGRSGYYGYPWLEALMGLRIARPHQINLAWQTLAVGDMIPAESDGTGYRVVAVQPLRMLVLAAPEADDSVPWSFRLLYRTFSWVFVLETARPGETRLIMRMRARLRRFPPLFFAAYLVDFGAFFLKRKMLLNLKLCAETSVGDADAAVRQQTRAARAVR